MSAVPHSASPTRTASAPRSTPVREHSGLRHPRLRLVDGFKSASKRSRRGVWVAVGIIIAAFALQLWLSTVIIEDAYRADALSDQQLELEREHLAALESADAQSSPQHLAQLATELGMVPVGSSVFLDLESGTLLETGTVAPLEPIEPDLVENSILNPPVEEPGSGEASEKKSESAVPSEFEMSSPSTR